MSGSRARRFVRELFVGFDDPAGRRQRWRGRLECVTAALSTPFTDLVGCRIPLQQAAMGGVTTPALAGAVAQAGGLGMVPAAGLGPDAVVAQVKQALALSGPGGRVGASFLMPFLDEAVLEAAASGAGFVECFYGDPSARLVERIHAGGALAAWQVGSLDEARRRRTPAAT